MQSSGLLLVVSILLITTSTFTTYSLNSMPETNIILAVIGVVGLLSTLAVYSRANNASLSYEKRLVRQRNINRVAHEDE